MKKLPIALAMASCFAFSNAMADDDDDMRMFEVTVTNTTYHHVITPPIVVAHKKRFNLFEMAQPASAGVIAMAEGGDTSVLVSDLSSDSQVKATATGGGLIFPGQSAVINIMAPKKSRFSVAAMLAKTNDAFIAVRGLKAKSHAPAMTYDAGSESNNELCSFIPACSHADHISDDGEGYVTVHTGYHGIGDFPEEKAHLLDWRGPNAVISIK